VQAELLLDYLRGQADFPADAARALTAAANNPCQQYAVGIIEGEPIKPRPRKIFAPRLRCLEFLHRRRNFAPVHRALRSVATSPHWRQPTYLDEALRRSLSAARLWFGSSSPASMMGVARSGGQERP